MKFSAVILAGGKSSRMGRDKAWLQINDESLLGRQIRLVREVGAQEVFISGRLNTDYSSFNGRVLHDHVLDAGPLGGIESALAGCSSPLLLVLAVDMPKVNAQLLRQLLYRCVEGAGAIPRVIGKIEPLVAFYPKAASNLRLLTQTNFATGQIEAEETDSSAPAKSPSATRFAEECVERGLAQFVNVGERKKHFFANWNLPEQVE